MTDNVHDYRIVKGMGASELVGHMSASGFQGSEIGEAVRIIKKMKEGVVPKTFFFPEIDGLKDLEDFFRI